MAQRLSRKELYDLVWSQPLRILSGRFGISDVALKKCCQRAAIPTPERGYWARKDAGKDTFVPAFPVRLPAMEDEVVVGGGNDAWYGPQWTREELLGPSPPAPTFDTPLEAVRESIAKTIGRVTVPREVRAWHPAIQRLLNEDEARREKLRKHGWSWDKPLFESPLEMRRLRLLNSLFVATNKFNGKASPDKDARKASIRFYKEHVAIALGTSKVPRGKSTGTPTNRLTLTILKSYNSDDEVKSWHDGEGTRLEMHIAAVAVEIVLLAEAEYRESNVRGYNWRIKRKAELEEEDRKRKLEAERAEQERIKRLEQARIDGLLSDAVAFQKSVAIRQYVEAIRTKHASSPIASDEELRHWSAWALEQADRIDPAVGSNFLLRMREEQQRKE